MNERNEFGKRGRADLEMKPGILNLLLRVVSGLRYSGDTGIYIHAVNQTQFLILQIRACKSVCVCE